MIEPAGIGRPPDKPESTTGFPADPTVQIAEVRRWQRRIKRYPGLRVPFDVARPTAKLDSPKSRKQRH